MMSEIRSSEPKNAYEFFERLLKRSDQQSSTYDLRCMKSRLHEPCSFEEYLNEQTNISSDT